MVANTISYENAKQILLKLNVSPSSISSFIGQQNKPVPIKQIELFQRYNKILLPSTNEMDNLSFLWSEISRTHASHQIYEYKKLKYSLNNSKKVKLIIMERFIDYFEKLDKAFKQKKLKAYLYLLGDSPFNLNLRIFDINDKNVGVNSNIATLNFDLYFNKNNEPSIIIGNMQGRNKEKLDYFLKIHKTPFLNTAINCIQEAFPGKEQTIALDPKFHQGYKNPYEGILVKRLIEKKKATELDNRYTAKLKKLIEEEKQEIITHGTGMHKAAYKASGYKKPGPKSSGFHYWRRVK